jgi:D-sedoheptulose 7-phosphate isomerase/D-glycero-D-manno-heptose 1,7-bisphosphate phosphatase
MTSTYDLDDLDVLAPAPPALTPKFPTVPHRRAASYCGAYLEESVRAANSIDLAQVELAAAILIEAYSSGSAVFSCGNGGSASVANHLQCDHIKGVSNGTDLSPRVMSLSTNVELLTAIANDIAFDQVFAYQLQAQARPKDVLIAISSSGCSANIIHALTYAREHDIRTIALTGFGGGDTRAMAEVAIHVDCTNYGVVEDLHQAVMHAIAQFVRQSRMSPSAIATSTF